MNNKLREFKNNLTFAKICEYGAFIYMLLLIVFVVFLNILRASNYVEFDEAKLYRHAIEMWNNRSFIIPDWDYISTMELDCSLLLALPIYGVTHNIYLSFGIANLIFLFLFLFVIWDILRKMKVKTIYKYFVMILFLLPYRIGMLEYLNMMFFNGSQYVVKVLVPMLLIDLFLEDKLFNIKNMIILALFAVLMTITSMSSGTYVFLSGVFPVIFAVLFNVILSGDIKKFNRNKIILTAVSFAAFFAGYLLCRILNVAPNSEGIDLIATADFAENIRVTFWGFLSVFINPGSVSVLSIYGIKQLIRIAFTILVIIVILFNVINLLKGSDELRLLTMPFIVTTIILNLTKCCFSDVYYPERYFFIGLVPLFVSLPYILESIEKGENTLLAKSMLIVGMLVCVCMGPVCIQDCIGGIRTGYEGGYNNVKELCNYAKSQNAETVFFLHDLPDCEVARLFDTDRKYTIIKLNDDGSATLDTRDFYFQAGDRSYYSDSNWLVVPQGSGYFDSLPEYLRSSYSYLNNVAGFDIYSSTENKFDNLVGLPKKEWNKGIDFVYSTGYVTAGNINLYGYLEAEGCNEYALFSPRLDIAAPSVKVTLIYEADKTSKGDMELRIMDENMQLIDSKKLSASEERAELVCNGYEHLYVGVYMDKGSKCTIKRIEFER